MDWGRVEKGVEHQNTVMSSCNPAKEPWSAQGSETFADPAGQVGGRCRTPWFLISGAKAGGKFPLPEPGSRRISDMHKLVSSLVFSSLGTRTESL